MLGSIKGSTAKPFIPAGYELRTGLTNQRSGSYTGSLGTTITITEDIIPLSLYVTSSHDETRSTSGISASWSCTADYRTILSGSCNRYGTLNLASHVDLAGLYGWDFEILKERKSFNTRGGYLSARYTFAVTSWLQKK